MTRLLTVAGLFFSIGIVILAGCKPTNSGQIAKSNEDAKQDSKTAEQIMESMRSVYASTESYSDQGALHLVYRLNGGLMEEHHPWEVAFQRPGRLVASIYNSRLKSDGQQMSCFVYDFPSGNLDNQHLLLPSQNGLPFSRLMTDSIARHFVAGQTELPLNSSHPMAFECFVPPTLALLTGQELLPWLQSNELTRVKDEEINGRPCYQVEVRSESLVFKVFIDRQNNRLVSIKYPVELLANELQATDEISDLSLFATFSNQQFDLPQEDFDLGLREGAKVVTRFVAVPEKFPCETIGEPVGSLSIDDMGGFPVKSTDWKGRVTNLIWMDEQTAGRVSDDFIDIVKQLKLDDYEFAVVLIGELTDNRNIAKMVAANIQILVDNQFKIGSKVGLQSTPAAVVIDRDGIVQYTQPLDPDGFWKNKLVTALQRIRQGERIAIEMREQYDLFLEQYRQRLIESNPDGNISFVNSQSHRFFQAEQRWSNVSVKLPGNVTTLNNSENQFIVCEGFQSVVVLGPDGEVKRRTTLPIAENESVSVVRVNPDKRSHLSMIAFSFLASQLTILDQNVGKQMEIPSRNDHLKVTDATWLDGSRIAFSIHESSEIAMGMLDGSPLKKVKLPMPARSLASVNRKVKDSDHSKSTLVVCLQDGQVVEVDGQETRSIELSGQTGEWVKARSESVEPNGDATIFVMLGVSESGRAVATGFDQYGSRRWSIPVGRQMHESQIQPVTHCNCRAVAGGIWAVASSDGRVTLISDDGRFADKIDLGFTPRGIELVSWDEKTLLIVSGPDGVTAWEIKTPTHTAMLTKKKSR